jgi:hypothetical protein
VRQRLVALLRFGLDPLADLDVGRFGRGRLRLRRRGLLDRGGGAGRGVVASCARAGAPARSRIAAIAAKTCRQARAIRSRRHELFNTMDDILALSAFARCPMSAWRRMPPTSGCDTQASVSRRERKYD